MEREKSVAKDLASVTGAGAANPRPMVCGAVEAMARGAGLDALAATIARAADQPGRLVA